jgi:hypothetical protein
MPKSKQQISGRVPSAFRDDQVRTFPLESPTHTLHADGARNLKPVIDKPVPVQVSSHVVFVDDEHERPRVRPAGGHLTIMRHEASVRGMASRSAFGHTGTYYPQREHTSRGSKSLQPARAH